MVREQRLQPIILALSNCCRDNPSRKRGTDECRQESRERFPPNVPAPCLNRKGSFLCRYPRDPLVRGRCANTDEWAISTIVRTDFQPSSTSLDGSAGKGGSELR